MEATDPIELDSLVPGPGEFTIVGALTEAERRERKARYAAHIRACLLYVARHLPTTFDAQHLPDVMSDAQASAALAWLREEADSVVGTHVLKSESAALATNGSLTTAMLDALRRATGAPLASLETESVEAQPAIDVTSGEASLESLIRSIGQAVASLTGAPLKHAEPLTTEASQRAALIEIRDQLRSIGVLPNGAGDSADRVTLLATELARLHPDNPLFSALARQPPQ